MLINTIISLDYYNFSCDSKYEVLRKHLSKHSVYILLNIKILTNESKYITITIHFSNVNLNFYKKFLDSFIHGCPL